MTELAVTLVVHILMIVVFVAAMGSIVWGTAWLVGGPWWPTVAFQAGQRGGAVHGLLWRSLLVVLTPPTLALGPSGMAAGVLLWLIFAPRWIGRRASAIAWDDDEGKPDLRQRALEVRNRRNEVLGQAARDGKAAWPEYIIDAAKAERQRLYQERFERDGREDTTTSAEAMP